MTPDETPTIAANELPAPKPAASHVGVATEVLPRPHEDRNDAGIPHPSHRAD